MQGPFLNVKRPTKFMLNIDAESSYNLIMSKGLPFILNVVNLGIRTGVGIHPKGQQTLGHNIIDFF